MDYIFDIPNKQISIGCDHAGFFFKEKIKTTFTTEGLRFLDLGTHSEESVDFPDYAHPVAESVEKGETSFGILLCGSANGVAITANKHQQIRAGLSWNEEVASLIRKHNDANIICIPARFVELETALNMIRIFMTTPFEGGRHERRVNKIRC